MSRLLRTLLVLPALAVPLSSAVSQSIAENPRRLIIVPTAGLLSFGDYFTGPGGIRFSNQDGLGYGAQLSIEVAKNLSLTGSVLHGTSDWSFDDVPLLGTIAVDGASLWLYDAGVRLQIPFAAASPVSAFAQATAGAIRYAVNNPLFTGHATNFAFSGGVGLMTRLGDRLSLQALLKDYVASFRSVDQGMSFGVEGQRAHTLALLLGLGVGL